MLTPLLAALALAGAPAPQDAPKAKEEAPPAVFVDRGACPFEGCAYRTWKAKADVPLLDAPGGRSTGVVVKKGEEVEALTGEVHVKPLRVVVRRATANGDESGVPGLAPGDAYWLLTYEGEGFFKIWVRGRISGLNPDYGWEGKHACHRKPEGCSGEPEGGRAAFLKWARDGAVWWVQVKTRSGAVGWTREPEKFDGKDLLG